MKLFAACAGVVVAVMLMLIQLGFREGVLNSTVELARRVEADLVVISPRTKTIFQSAPFPRRLLFRLPAHPQVDTVEEIYIGQCRFQNPIDHCEHAATIYGIDPRRSLLRLPGYIESASRLEIPDQLMLDSLARNSFGPLVAMAQGDRGFSAEVNLRRMQVAGTIQVGVPVSVDGAFYTSPANFLRLFPQRSAGAVDLGLVRLVPGANPPVVRDQLRSYLGAEAVVMTREELVDAEIAHVRTAAPVDFIFGMGVVVGFLVGIVVVYQILYTEVTNHLPQFGTLKAVGFTDGYLSRLVLGQAAILGLLGYFPGAILAVIVYQVASATIQIPFHMTMVRALAVLAATMVMCGVSAMIAIRKAQTADPADVF